MLKGDLYIHTDDVGIRRVVRILTTTAADAAVISVQFIGSRKDAEVRRAELGPAAVAKS